jgi:OHCU decarboxylase
MAALADFNVLSAPAAVAELLRVCHSTRWAESVAAERPFADLPALQACADETWLALDPADWLEALDGHPRIGEQGGSSPSLSRDEQSGLADVAVSTRALLAQGNLAYEERFGHVFLISAAGRTPEEILASLLSRLDNDPDTELRVATDQHRRITRLRLEKLFS